jgi:hypothetical protein
MASKRTINRVKEHSDHWIDTTFQSAGIPSSDYQECKDQPLTFFSCKCNPDTECNWFGWLPIQELKELNIILI